jgi:3-methyladenine DNA glycosylase AlkD
MKNLVNLKKELKNLENKEQAKNLQRFFKTGKGEYGEGDIFLGLKVPVQREIAKKYYDLDLKQLKKLIESKIHEHRLVALFILINKYKTTNHKKIVTHFYLKNASKGYINNWDLVDLSAPKILGVHLLDKNNNRKILHKLAKSNNLWERRIAILSTFTFINKKDFKDALNIAKILMRDEHDLIHKAVGWMLREIGKRNLSIEENFLKKNNNYKKMPRTMLRYAIEKFPKNKKRFYMGKR